MGSPHDSSQAEQRLFVDFVSAHQIAVVAEIAKEAPEFPKCLRCAIESSREWTILMFSWLDDDKPQNVERPLRMPAVEGPIDADQEDAFQCVITCALFTMQTRDMSFHGATSCDLA